MKTINVYAQDDINEIRMEIYKDKSNRLAEELKDKNREIENLKSIMKIYKHSADVCFASLMVCGTAVLVYLMITLF